MYRCVRHTQLMNKLSVTHAAWKRNGCWCKESSVSMGVCTCVCRVLVQGIKRGYGCAYVCLSSTTKSPVDGYLCVFVMEELLEVLKRGTPRDVAKCVYACEIKPGYRWKWVCVGVCHRHSPEDRYFCVYVCICMLTPLNYCNYIRQFFYC